MLLLFDVCFSKTIVQSVLRFMDIIYQKVVCKHVACFESLHRYDSVMLRMKGKYYSFSKIASAAAATSLLGCESGCGNEQTSLEFVYVTRHLFKVAWLSKTSEDTRAFYWLLELKETNRTATVEIGTMFFGNFLTQDVTSCSDIQTHKTPSISVVYSGKRNKVTGI